MVLERHPQIGFRMLESLGVDPVAEWVLHHHERWDGSGYPDGLPGDQIPLGARIIFVADAYDAMTSERVYRRRVLADAGGRRAAALRRHPVRPGDRRRAGRRAGRERRASPRRRRGRLVGVTHSSRSGTDTREVPRYARLGEEAGRTVVRSQAA